MRKEIQFKDIFIDGTKIEANANRYLFIWKKSVEKNLNKRYKSVTADAGYESEENYMYLESKQQKSLIKPQTYEKSKTRKFKTDISK